MIWVRVQNCLCTRTLCTLLAHAAFATTICCNLGAGSKTKLPFLRFFAVFRFPSLNKVRTSSSGKNVASERISGSHSRQSRCRVPLTIQQRVSLLLPFIRDESSEHLPLGRHSQTSRLSPDIAWPTWYPHVERKFKVCSFVARHHSFSFLQSRINAIASCLWPGVAPHRIRTGTVSLCRSKLDILRHCTACFVGR